MTKNTLFTCIIVFACICAFIVALILSANNQKVLNEDRIQYNKYILRNAPTDTLKIRARTDLEFMLYEVVLDKKQVNEILNILEKNK